MGRPKGSKDKKPQHKWTDEEKEYLASIVKGSTYKEITRQMNDKFEYNFSEEQVKGMMYRNKLTTGTGGYFKKGSTPWNKGLKGYMGANKTSFKKGTIPPNQVPIGTESITKGGYIKVKVGEPNKWKLKQRYIYEQHYGEIPKDCNVIFADKNIRNFDINNLVLVSKAEMLILNNNKLIFEDKELTKVGVNIAKVIDKTKKRSK
ncbi:MAG: HNH endonuclease signature motif containing protein [Terrisporobacter sp.]|uniref:HNH endonuclease signature motif containing protein n=1 Tax=Terrisporobacter sp. TaxID=1965305 RepID=UPI002A91A258|nr:HNH endonuclease signature motif containing protein [Terrisporobacter sp.]MDY6151939.1 HNH endonuclease signature motif containing protein [Terrisporobacter sp.]